MAEAALSVSETVLWRETKRVTRRTMLAVIDVLYARELVQIEHDLRLLADDHLRMQRRRFELGEVAYEELVRAELAAADARLAENDARTGLRLADLRLAEAAGLQPSQPPIVTGELFAGPSALPALETVLDRAVLVAPELAEGAGQVEQSREQLTLERWRSLPDASLGVRARDGLADNPDRVGTRLAVELPLFDRNQGRIQRGEAEVLQAAANAQGLEFEAMAEVAAVYYQLQDADASLAYYAEHVLPLASSTKAAISGSAYHRARGGHQVVALLQQLGHIQRVYLQLRRDHVQRQLELELFLECPLADLGAAAERGVVPAITMPFAPASAGR